MVYAVKKCDMEAPSPEVANAAESMTKKQAKDMMMNTKASVIPVNIVDQMKIWEEEMKMTMNNLLWCQKTHTIAI